MADDPSEVVDLEFGDLTISDFSPYYDFSPLNFIDRSNSYLNAIPKIKLGGASIDRDWIGSAAVRYACPDARRKRPNRHAAKRWMHEFAEVARVAEDMLQEGRRGQAIAVLLEVVDFEDAINLSEAFEPVRIQDLVQINFGSRTDIGRPENKEAVFTADTPAGGAMLFESAKPIINGDTLQSTYKITIS